MYDGNCFDTINDLNEFCDMCTCVSDNNAIVYTVQTPRTNHTKGKEHINVL